MTKEDAMDKLEPDTKPEDMTLEMVLDKRKSKIMQMGGFTEKEVKQFLMIANASIAANPKLQACTLESIITSIYEAAQCGLVPNSITQEGHLVPYYDSKARASKCRFITGYRGIIKMLYATDLFSMVDVQAVHGNDYFDEVLGSHPRIDHKPPTTGTRGEFIGAYAILKDKDTGEVKHHYITKEDALIHGERYSPSKAKVDEVDPKTGKKTGKKIKVLVGPWVDNFPAMCMKTSLRQVGKYTPSSPATERLHRMIKREEMVENPPTYTITEKEEIQTPEELPAGEEETSSEGSGEFDEETGEELPKSLFPEEDKGNE